MVIDTTKSSPPPLPDPERKSAKATLHTAINTVQHLRLRAILQIICDSSTDAARIAERCLLVPDEAATVRMVDKKNTSREPREEEKKEEKEEAKKEKEEEEEEDEDQGVSESDTEGQDSEDSSGGSNTHDSRKTNEDTIPTESSQKRLRPRYAMCENCDEEFDVTTNGKRSCVWHPGNCEADYDADIWADHDEDCHGRISDLEDEVPEGFIYTCCNRAGDADGCRIGTHVENVVVSKRMRV